MQTLHLTIKKNVTLIVLGSLISSLHPVWAESDMQLQEKALKAREISRHQAMGHNPDEGVVDETGGFRGVYYGYLPCTEKDCDGLKLTLSLKQKNNYLLVSQFAKASSREYYEKGKYEWDDKTHMLSLLPNKNGTKRQFSIQNESTIVQLNNASPSNQEDFTLRRSDVAKSREVHIH